MVEHCHHARFVFNIGLEQRALWSRDKHNRGSHPNHGLLDAARVNTASQMRELAELRGDLPWLKAGSSSVQQAALRDLNTAFANFYARRAKFPRFKARSEREGGFVIRDLAVRRLNRKWGLVTVPKVGRVRFRVSRPWVDIECATSARVTHRNGRWHISFTTGPAQRIEAGTGAVAGIDRGVANTIAVSDGQMIQAPSLTEAERNRFMRLQQRLARQQSGSGRRGKTLEQLAVLRSRLEDRRTDWVEQTTTNLARTYDLVAVEDLHVANMVRRPAPKPDPELPGVFLPNGAKAKASLNRAILASMWGRFHTRLGQKMVEGTLLRIDARNTSRTCATCGHCARENRESQAVFECAGCGHVAHADTNAAVVILDRALNNTMAAGHAVAGRGSPAVSAGSANQPVAKRPRITGRKSSEDVKGKMCA